MLLIVEIGTEINLHTFDCYFTCTMISVGWIPGTIYGFRHCMAKIFNSFDGFCVGGLTTHPKPPFVPMIVTIWRKKGLGNATHGFAAPGTKWLHPEWIPGTTWQEKKRTLYMNSLCLCALLQPRTSKATKKEKREMRKKIR